MIPWLIAGVVTLVVIVAAAIIVFRVVIMVADDDVDENEIEDYDEIDDEWRAVRPHARESVARRRSRTRDAHAYQ
jgi:hypothetical protein